MLLLLFLSNLFTLYGRVVHAESNTKEIVLLFGYLTV